MAGEIFLSPVPIPEGGIFDNPGATICINTNWITVISGVIELLADQYAWEGTESERLDAKEQIEQLLAKFGVEEDCP